METEYISSTQGGLGQSIKRLAQKLAQSLTWFDYLFAIALLLGAIYAEYRFSDFMDVYEQTILFACVPSFALIGWLWKPMRNLMIGSTVLALLAVYFYQTPEGGQLARAEQAFFSEVHAL